MGSLSSWQSLDRHRSGHFPFALQSLRYREGNSDGSLAAPITHEGVVAFRKKRSKAGVLLHTASDCTCCVVFGRDSSFVFRHNGYFVDLFVRESNTVAIDMYKKLGYVCYRRVIKYYSGEEDAWGESSGPAFWPLSWQRMLLRHQRSNSLW
jgi:hypothetical protein